MPPDLARGDGWVVGRHPVLEALRSGRSVTRLLIAHGSRGLADLMEEARDRGVPIQPVVRFTLDKIAGEHPHQGVAAAIPAHEYADFEEVLAKARESKERAFLLVLDELQDPHNLGSILRSADAARVDGVIIGKHRSVGLTQTVVKTSAGAVEYVPVARVTNVVRALARLKEEGYWVVGTDADAPKDVREGRYDRPVALVIGGEEKGLGRLVAETCHEVVHIPMRGHLSSLNASVAAALALYEIHRQRSPSKVSEGTP
jgi:23S rRNA (guanosine2251-2'-O)-methyltransferase